MQGRQHSRDDSNLLWKMKHRWQQLVADFVGSSASTTVQCDANEFIRWVVACNQECCGLAPCMHQHVLNDSTGPGCNPAMHNMGTKHAYLVKEPASHAQNSYTSVLNKHSFGITHHCKSQSALYFLQYSDGTTSSMFFITRCICMVIRKAIRVLYRSQSVINWYFIGDWFAQNLLSQRNTPNARKQHQRCFITSKH